MDVFKLPDTEKPGIYAIINIEEMAAYVGKANNLKRRANEHSKSLIAGKHANKELQKSVKHSLHFLVLCENENPAMLDLLEKLYMYEFATRGFYLYNAVSGKTRQETKDSVMWMLERMYEAGNKTEKAIKKEYGRHLGILRMTKPENRQAKLE